LEALAKTPAANAPPAVPLTVLGSPIATEPLPIAPVDVALSAPIDTAPAPVEFWPRPSATARLPLAIVHLSAARGAEG